MGAAGVFVLGNLDPIIVTMLVIRGVLSFLLIGAGFASLIMGYRLYRSDPRPPAGPAADRPPKAALPAVTLGAVTVGGSDAPDRRRPWAQLAAEPRSLGAAMMLSAVLWGLLAWLAVPGLRTPMISVGQANVSTEQVARLLSKYSDTAQGVEALRTDLRRVEARYKRESDGALGPALARQREFQELRGESQVHATNIDAIVKGYIPNLQDQLNELKKRIDPPRSQAAR